MNHAGRWPKARRAVRWLHVEGTASFPSGAPVEIRLLEADAENPGASMPGEGSGSLNGAAGADQTRRGSFVASQTIVRLAPGGVDFVAPPGRLRLEARRIGEPDAALLLEYETTGTGEMHGARNGIELCCRVREISEHPTGAFGIERPQGTIHYVSALRNDLFSRRAVALGRRSPFGMFRAGYAGIAVSGGGASGRPPVLFVHGAGDSPRSFSRLAKEAESRGYEPWHYFYPSGLPLSFAGRHLCSILSAAYLEQRFQSLPVVAHSMGGLIAVHALGMLSSAGERFLVPQLITLSTPWNGHGAAKVGTRISPRVRPLWREIASGSAFLERIHRVSLPRETRHHLLFSYRRRRVLGFVVSGLPMAQNHDGFVTLESQLPWGIQQRAATIRGFNEAHHGILASSGAASWVGSILANGDRARAISAGERLAGETLARQTEQSAQEAGTAPRAGKGVAAGSAHS